MAALCEHLQNSSKVVVSSHQLLPLKLKRRDPSVASWLLMVAVGEGVMAAVWDSFWEVGDGPVCERGGRGRGGRGRGGRGRGERGRGGRGRGRRGRDGRGRGERG